MSCTELQNSVDQFSGFTQKPVNFLSVQTDAKEGIKNLVKTLYDFTKSQENAKAKGKPSALRKLIVEDFDEEQIWQQIELQNTECWDNLVWEVANCITDKNNLEFPLKFDDHAVQDPEKDTAGSESEENDSVEEENERKQKKVALKVKSKSKSNSKPSIVDDKFFKLQEMEQFLLKEEKEGKPSADSDDDDVDLFEDIGSEGSEDEGGKDMKYADFFMGDADDDNDDNEMEEDDEHVAKAPNKKKKVSFALEEPDNDDDEKENLNSESEDDEKDEEVISSKTPKDKETKFESKSEFELRQQRLKQQISRLEERTLSEAPWQLKGEVDATKRPQNSLLEEVVDFDLTSRPPPIITEQTTQTLEDIIRQRIKDKAWDDVERKEKPTEDILSFRKTAVLDQSKSKMSLAQVYESEYLKQKQASSGETVEEEEPEAHKEIRTAMKSLFSKLDALCNYHYTPKAAQPEIKIVTNTPAITMEEVAPVATSDAALLAPEEIMRKNKGDLMSKEERTDTDKKRERRKKKKMQREKGGVPKVTDQRNTKKGAEVADKSLKTSKAFFQQLNDDASSKIKKKAKGI